ncbi:hypothetical protein POM88_054922 [Heracleum sosnowskyi]|uniref:Uncharacterized protein n=1 Tax=Heracleum sosnowskyi TaxID=360622 RepID=A0AAD8GMK3_9APIA|nr:hypothetical protein POM88_054922 [Heracleum sosnowskyi]
MPERGDEEIESKQKRNDDSVPCLDIIPFSGVVHERTLSKLLKSKCWYVGSSKMDVVEGAYKFNESWQTDSRIGHHDCRDYTNGLVEYLTGEENVLERLGKSGWS